LPIIPGILIGFLENPLLISIVERYTIAGFQLLEHKQRLPNVDRSEYIVYQLLLGCTAGMVESDIFVEEVS
jgi:hypothetical protein